MQLVTTQDDQCHESDSAFLIVSKMASDEPQGCLFAFLRLFGLSGAAAATARLPYRLGEGLLTPAELSFYRVLRGVVGDQYVICPKVRLSDFFIVTHGDGRQAAMNRINQKHVDFLLCDPDSLRPSLAIELDDASHDRQRRRDRDVTVDEVFASAGLALLHVRAAATYRPQELRHLIESAGDAAATLKNADRAPEQPFEQPVCPKCDSPMIRRTAKKGSAAGAQFWGCPNYPQCRETLPIE